MARNMSISRIVALIFLFGILLACAATTKPLPHLKDEGLQSATYLCTDAPWCNLTAVERPWPEVTQASGRLPVTNLMFLVQIPNAPEKLLIPSGKLPMFAANYANYSFTIGLDEFPDVDSVPGMHHLQPKDKRRYSPLDHYEIMFTATPDQQEPEGSYDRAVWRSAFFGKVTLFNTSATEAEIYRNGPWTVYMLQVNGPTYTRSTAITHKDFPLRYLRISDRNAPKAVITDLIATIQLHRQ